MEFGAILCVEGCLERIRGGLGVAKQHLGTGHVEHGVGNIGCQGSSCQNGESGVEYGGRFVVKVKNSTGGELDSVGTHHNHYSFLAS